MILQSDAGITIEKGLIMIDAWAERLLPRLKVPGNLNDTVLQSSSSSEEKAPEPEGVDNSLNDTAQGEREYVRRRLQSELGREPSEEEVDEWLRRHTEGY